MAGPLESNEVQRPVPLSSYAGPMGAVGWGLSWADYLVYSLERLIVVISLITMTIIEFIYILSLYVTEQRISINKLMDPANTTAEFPVGLVVLLSFLVVMMGAVVNNTILGRKKGGEKRPLAVRLVTTVGLTGVVSFLSYLSIAVEESSTYYLLVTSLVMLPALAYFVMRGERVMGSVVAVMTAFAYWGSYEVPTGYSWADKRALFLLLWVGFLGASMATKEGRHIKIDVARKFLPDSIRPKYNAVSYFIAAGFTGFLVYIGGIYMFNEDYGRFWARTIPGEIPDWLKVASIPVAFLIMSIRFFARSIKLAIWGEDPPEEPPAADESDDKKLEEVPA